MGRNEQSSKPPDNDNQSPIVASNTCNGAVAYALPGLCVTQF